MCAETNVDKLVLLRQVVDDFVVQVLGASVFIASANAWVIVDLHHNVFAINLFYVHAVKPLPNNPAGFQRHFLEIFRSILFLYRHGSAPNGCWACLSVWRRASSVLSESYASKQPEESYWSLSASLTLRLCKRLWKIEEPQTVKMGLFAKRSYGKTA